MNISKQSVLSLSSQEQPWLQQKRLDAWNIFSSLPALPSFLKYGLNIITPLQGMGVEEIDLGEGNTVTVSPAAGVQVTSPPENIFSLLPQERFSLLHQAFCTNVLCLKIPDGVSLPEPLIISKSMAMQNFFTHLVIDVGKDCKLSIVESLSGSGTYHSSGVEIFLGENSSLLFGSAQHLSPSTNSFSIRRAVLARDSRLDWVTIDTGSRLLLSSVGSSLEGQGSSSFTKMMFFGNEQQHFDFDVSAAHKAPDTTSDIASKGVLDGRAKMVFRGLVKIHKEAPRSSGYQKEDTLLLSPDAEADPVPNLEIDNNDVRCSHGTTVGQVDRDKLFYLMSRGLDQEEATRVIVRGFFEPIIASVPRTSLQDNIRQRIEKKLEERNEAVQDI